MTLEELNTLLTGTGIPVSFSSVPLDRNFAADGVVYYSRKVIIVRLYTDKRDEVSEGKVQTALSSMYYSKDIQFLDAEKIYEITYTIEV